VSLSASEGFENVTVNAVDSTFHIINGVTDTITLTSSDGQAFLPNPTAMANGTVGFTGNNGVVFQSEGPQTVTATDETTATIPSATSSSVTVGP
jgi:hypothetical protein